MSKVAHTASSSSLKTLSAKANFSCVWSAFQGLAERTAMFAAKRDILVFGLQNIQQNLYLISWQSVDINVDQSVD